MSERTDFSAGTLRISKDVLATIARTSALETEGVAAIAENPVDIRGSFAKGQLPKTVSVSIKDELAEIELQLIIKSGCRINSVSEKVQKAVKESIQSMTGITVSRVNIVIAGIAFDRSKEAVN